MLTVRGESHLTNPILAKEESLLSDSILFREDSQPLQYSNLNFLEQIEAACFALDYGYIRYRHDK